MAETVFFDNKVFVEPSTSARTIGGVRNSGAPLDYGKVCIIDTGIGANYGGGKSSHGSGGVKLNLDDYKNTVTSSAEMKRLVKGGVLWDLADYLFRPSNSANGPREVYIIHARTATVATQTITVAATGTLVINTKETGLQANGVTGLLTQMIKGYGFTLTAGVIDPTKYIVEFYVGTYPGVISGTSLTYGGITQVQAELNRRLIVKSAEVNGLTELVAWSETSPEFQEYFTMGTLTDNGTTGLFAVGDLTTYGGLDTVFSGATETYNATDLDDVLDDIVELDNTFFLADKFNADASGTNNAKILSFINTNADFKKFLVIGGSDNSTNMATQSIAPAVALNSRYAVVVHGGQEVPYELNPSLMVTKPSIYKAAQVVGRLSGLQPQESITWKDLRITKEIHVLTKNERVQLLQSGVLHTKNVNGRFLVNQGVNTKQDNNYLISVDGSSHEISIERISAQLNRTLQEGARQFIGGNLSTVQEADVIEYAESVLLKNKAIPGERDGLIVGFGNIRATRVGSTWNVNYDYQANSPINKVFSTGTIIDPTLN